MKTGLRLALALLLTVLTAPLRAGEIVDRIVVTVNGHAILLSDWDEALRYEALVNGRPLTSLTPDDRKATLNRLVDQELLREQMEGISFPHATVEQINQQVAQIRKQLPEAASDDAWRALLARYGFAEAEFRDRVAAQLDTLRFLDQRLRPSVHIDAASIETYYREKFLPELRKTGAAEAPLAEVSPKIEELLAQERMDQLLADWLRDLRQQSSIRETAVAGPAGERGPQAQ